MTLTREFLTFFTCSAMVMVYHCKSDCPPPPTGLSHKWLDKFTVNVSWQKPSGLPDGYKYCVMRNADEKSVMCTPWRNFTDSCLTEEIGSDRWTYHIWTVGSKSCESSDKSERVSITIQTPKPRAEVKDIKCVISSSKGMNCSWIPGNQSFKLSYRICGHQSGRYLKALKECDQPYSSATRNGCYLEVDAVNKKICMLLESEAGMITFRPDLVSKMIPSPKLSIREEEDKLKLRWTPPEFGAGCWIYEVCYNKCNEPQKCLNFNTKADHTDMQVAYDKSCLYEFKSKVRTGDQCGDVFSDFGDIVSYGSNEPPNETLTVVAVVLPIILSVCIILSCYCFRRHRSIICPVIPDPSAIFKEMMMNGNKEMKTGVHSLYTPVPEPIEPCRITLVTENSVLQQNSGHAL